MASFPGTTAHQKPEVRAFGPFAWNGWRMPIPDGWDAVRLEGNGSSGYALLADLHRPRMGVKWERLPQRNFDAHDAVDRALRNEVGRLAAAESRECADRDPQLWQACRLYTEPKLPGRDVFIGYSVPSGRILQVIFHIQHPSTDRAVRDSVLAGILDGSLEESQFWAVFGLSCTVPRTMVLSSRQLLAGDLSLAFRSESSAEELLVREIAVAELALKRWPIEQWLRRQQGQRRKHYRPDPNVEPLEVKSESDAPRRLVGCMGTMRRRRRFFFLRKLPRVQTTLALHDATRDRLVIVQSNNAELAARVARSVGVAG